MAVCGPVPAETPGHPPTITGSLEWDAGLQPGRGAYAPFNAYQTYMLLYALSLLHPKVVALHSSVESRKAVVPSFTTRAALQQGQALLLC